MDLSVGELTSPKPECGDNRKYPTDDAEDSQNVWQQRYTNRDVEQEDQAEDDAQRTKDANTPSTTLESLDQVDDPDDETLDAQDNYGYIQDNPCAPKGVLDDDDASKDTDYTGE